MNRSLRMHVRPILGEPTLVLAFEGWNDACESASSTVRFVDDVVRTVPLAEIDPDDYYDFTVRRPEVRYQAGRASTIHWPANEFRYGVTADGLELITGLAVEPHTRWRSYSEAVVELAVDMNVQRCLLVGAYLADVVYSQPVVVSGFASDPELLERYQIEPSNYEHRRRRLRCAAAGRHRVSRDLVRPAALHQRDAESAGLPRAAAQGLAIPRDALRAREAEGRRRPVRRGDLARRRRRRRADRVRQGAEAPRVRAVGSNAAVRERAGRTSSRNAPGGRAQSASQPSSID
jgi:hypothetical protein